MDKRFLISLFFITSLFLVACAKTQVVKIDQQPSAPAPAANASPSDQGALVTVEGGKTATSCDDSDLDDPESVGRVRVQYDDGTSKDFYDDCPGDASILTEYLCKGNNVATRNVICKQACIKVLVKDPSCPGCKVGFCMN